MNPDYRFDDDSIDAETARIAFGKLVLGARLGEALKDENGLLPTGGAIDVLAGVIAALNATDERWAEKSRPGIPSVTDYAAGVIDRLRRRYSTTGVIL